MSEKEQKKEIQDLVQEPNWDQKNISDFFNLLLKIDMRENPELYKAKKHD